MSLFYETNRTPMYVSMKSGLEDRNNAYVDDSTFKDSFCLNEVRPGRPEQWLASEGRLG